MFEDVYQFDLPRGSKSIIKVIGVGGGGSNAVNHMYRQGIRGVDFVICNTDNQALQSSPIPNRVQLGKALTFGRGAGNEPGKGRESALENLDDIKNFLSDNTKMVFLTAGMGGGTGTGAAPVIAEAATEMGILTVGIVTLPFAFEGQKRWNQAVEGIRNLKDHVDALLVIHNDRLRDIYGDQPLSVAFGHADNVLAMAAKGIAEIITVHGYVNVDFADVRTVMERSGVAIMGSGVAEGENRAYQAISKALISPLLNNNNLKGARNILLNISSSKEQEVLMDEITEIMDFIQHCTEIQSDIIWGNTTDETLGSSLSVTIVATGLQTETGLGDIVPDFKQVQYPRKNTVGAPTLPVDIFGVKQKAEDVPMDVEGFEPELVENEVDVVSEPVAARGRKVKEKKQRQPKTFGWIGSLFDEKDDELK
ncbi:MAG: cell division protein FtsZ [Bacteroidetes bacterium GWF2_49_14]|nr:MAG: cell division protein FtsZ [Bacteroidetes bacterium GWF2_49_14]HBB91244.1 cell division protein FtsZ [Bacteroidales bacterium]